MKDKNLLQASIMSFARTDKGVAVLLRPLDEERVVPIFIGTLEAQSIMLGLSDEPMPRPFTHDLIITMLEKVRVQIVALEILDYCEEIFYATLIIKHGARKIQIDCRPSDGLALVTRQKLPLFISRHVVDKTGIPLSMVADAAAVLNPDDDDLEDENDDENDEESTEEDELLSIEHSLAEQLQKATESLDSGGINLPVANRSEANKEERLMYSLHLHHRLETALEQENYEEAAKIRDELKILQDGGSISFDDESSSE